MLYLIDIGSSTIKVYGRKLGDVSILEAKTFDFKEGFDSEQGLSENNRESLYSYFSELVRRYSLTRSNAKLYATGIFRDLTYKQKFIEEFYANTHLYFNIISHKLEAFYLEKAWIGKYTGEGNLLVINIGGKTTELIFYSNGTVVDRKMLPIGVGVILKKYPQINEEFCPIPLSDIIEYVHCELPYINNAYNTAIYTGGELTYMQLVGYKLQDNSIFSDNKHPSIITYDNYCTQNKRIFDEISITDLRKMMPRNPSWMNGARACSALAQAICENYGINIIVPSDANLIDGVNVQETQRAVICGSFNKHLDNISQLIQVLKDRKIEVLSPLNTEVVGTEGGFVLFEDDVVINHCTWSVEALHLRAIENSDIVIVCNYNNYVGSKTSLEIGYAYKCGKKVIFLEDNEIVEDFDIPSEIGLL